MSRTDRTTRTPGTWLTLSILLAVVVVIAAAVGFGAAWLLDGHGEPPTVDAAAGSDRPTLAITLNGRRLDLELAVGPDRTRRGLMGRADLDPNGGMLFVFGDERQRWFWMNNCLIDLDVIFLDDEGHVMSYTTMTAPPPDRPEAELERYPSGGPARFAIELRAGTADKLGVEPGQRIDGPWKRLKRLAE
jgi:uncharacterized membrane protein (UPF0127 family)